MGEAIVKNSKKSPKYFANKNKTPIFAIPNEKGVKIILPM